MKETRGVLLGWAAGRGPGGSARQCWPAAALWAAGEYFRVRLRIGGARARAAVPLPWGARTGWHLACARRDSASDACDRGAPRDSGEILSEGRPSRPRLAGTSRGRDRTAADAQAGRSPRPAGVPCILATPDSVAAGAATWRMRAHWSIRFEQVD